MPNEFFLFSFFFPNTGLIWMHKSLKNGPILIKNVLLKLCFRDEGYLYVNFLIFIVTIYCKCILFQFFSRGIRKNIPNLTGLQNGRISSRKNSRILLKNVFFEACFSR